MTAGVTTAENSRRAVYRIDRFGVADCSGGSYRRPFFRSRLSRLLALAALGVMIVTVLIPHMPCAAMLGFGIMPPHFYPILALIILAYVIAAESAKRVAATRNRNT